MVRFIAVIAALILTVTAADARPRHHHHHHKHHRHVVATVADPGCNIIFPCEGVTISQRGQTIERAMPFGKAQKTYRRAVERPVLWAGSSGLVARARSYMGQTASQIGLRRTLWCSAFLRHLTNARGVDDRAISWLSQPRTTARVGAIAVMRHHVGIVTGFDRHGNPILVSGNHGRRVGEGVYSAHRIIAYVSAS
jgi:hypothetical protein